MLPMTKPEDLRFDPSLNFLHRQDTQLDHIFFPKNVAVIGASETENSVGRTLIWNLLKTPFGGTVYPVNPKRSSVLGIKAYPNVKAIPEKIDLAVVVTPAKTVPAIISECADIGIPTAVIISAGFKEMGESGQQLEDEILKHARRGKMRIIGPNCLGVMNPVTGLNATFAEEIALKGNLAFISQSGALITAVLDWSLREKVGFSAVVSIGSMADVGWGDLINYFGSDPNTKSILIYMESIGDPRAFLSATREVALTKPIILIKAGRSAESAKAAASHTGSLSGSDEVLNAALRRVGVLRVDTISDLFSMAAVLAKQPRPKGPQFAILTNAGGPGVIATDALIEHKGKLAPLDKTTFASFNALLPPHWSRNNPVDILGDASPETYAKAVEILSKDSTTDGILVILTPQDMTDPTETAEKIKPFAHLPGKPIIASWMGGKSVQAGDAILSKAGIPTFEFPDDACKAFAYMWNYSYNLKGLYEIPALSEDITEEAFLAKHKEVHDILEKVRSEGRTILTEFESKRVLEAYDIPTVTTLIAKSDEEAVHHAENIGYPIVLKLYSETITHKTDVGGVKLNLNNAQAVKAAYNDIYQSVKKKAGEQHFQGVTVQPMIRLEGYELILGSSIDAQFGPTILFGMGGQLVEVFKDTSLGLPPLTTTLARRMMEQTKIYHALKGVRGRKAVDLAHLEKILVQFSNLIVQQRWIKECDINPLLAGAERIIALDARIVLHDKDEKPPRLAIRPYPTKYVKNWVVKDKTPIVIRPTRPEDEPAIAKFHKDLSQETIRQRYLKVLHYDQLVTHERLLRICFNDYDREITLLAEKRTDKEEQKEVMGIGRLTKIIGTNDAFFAMIMKDKWQNRGIGREILKHLLAIAKDEHIEIVYARMLKENPQMQKICKELGFSLAYNEKEDLVIAQLKMK